MSEHHFVEDLTTGKSNKGLVEQRALIGLQRNGLNSWCRWDLLETWWWSWPAIPQMKIWWVICDEILVENSRYWCRSCIFWSGTTNGSLCTLVHTSFCIYNTCRDYIRSSRHNRCLGRDLCEGRTCCWKNHSCTQNDGGGGRVQSGVCWLGRGVRADKIRLPGVQPKIHGKLTKTF